MAITDPVTGVRQTPEQLEAITSQQREGVFARFEGRFLSIQEQLGAFRKGQDEQKARVDAIEQKAKLSETGLVEKVSAHLSQREGDLVLKHTELQAKHDVLQKNFDELVSRINGLQPGFFQQTPVPEKAPVVPTKVPAPPPRPLPTSKDQPGGGA